MNRAAQYECKQKRALEFFGTGGATSSSSSSTIIKIKDDTTIDSSSNTDINSFIDASYNATLSTPHQDDMFSKECCICYHQIKQTALSSSLSSSSLKGLLPSCTDDSYRSEEKRSYQGDERRPLGHPSSKMIPSHHHHHQCSISTRCGVSHGATYNDNNDDDDAFSNADARRESHCTSTGSLHKSISSHDDDNNKGYELINCHSSSSSFKQPTRDDDGHHLYHDGQHLYHNASGVFELNNTYGRSYGTMMTTHCIYPESSVLAVEEDERESDSDDPLDDEELLKVSRLLIQELC